MTLIEGDRVNGREPAMPGAGGLLGGLEPGLSEGYVLAPMRELMKSSDPYQVWTGFDRLLTYLQERYQIQGDEDRISNILRRGQTAAILLDEITEAGNLRVVAPILVRPMATYMSRLNGYDSPREYREQGYHSKIMGRLVGYRLTKATGDENPYFGDIVFDYVADLSHSLRERAAWVCIKESETEPEFLLALAKNVVYWQSTGEDEELGQEILEYLRERSEVVTSVLMASAVDSREDYHIQGIKVDKGEAIELLGLVLGVESTQPLIDLVTFYRTNQTLHESTRISLIEKCIKVLSETGDSRVLKILRSVVRSYGDSGDYRWQRVSDGAGGALININIREKKMPSQVMQDAGLVVKHASDRRVIAEVVAVLENQGDVRYEPFFRSLIDDEEACGIAIRAIGQLPVDEQKKKSFFLEMRRLVYAGQLPEGAEYAIGTLPVDARMRKNFLRKIVLDRTNSWETRLGAVSAMARGGFNDSVRLLDEVVGEYGLRSPIGWRAYELSHDLEGLPRPIPVGF